MKYCIAIGKTTSPNTPLPLAGDFVETMRKAKAMGYDAVEIHTPDPDTLDIPALSAACDELNLGIATLGTGMIYGKYGLSLVDEAPENQARIVDMVNHYVDIAAALHSKVTIGSIKGNIPAGADVDHHMALMADRLHEIADYALSHGVMLLLEATNHYENNVLNTGRALASFIEANHLHGVQALVDSYHVNLEETSVGAGLRDAVAYLGHIHFADNTRLYPGSGTFNFAAFRDAIREIGYDGVLSVEARPLPDGETAAKESIAFFKTYFG